MNEAERDAAVASMDAAAAAFGVARALVLGLKFTADPPVVTPPVVVPPVVVPPVVVPPVVTLGPLSTLAAGIARVLSHWDLDYQDSDYSGWVYDEVGNQILFFGGGHGGGQHTAIRALNLSTLEWRDLYPTLAREFQIPANITGYWSWKAPGQMEVPINRHTYNDGCIVGRRLYLFGRFLVADDIARPPADLVLTPTFCWFDLDAGKWSWSQMKDVEGPGGARWPLWNYGGSAAQTPDGKKALVIEQVSGWATAYLYDTETDSARVLPNVLANTVLYAMKLVYFPPTGRYYAFTNKGVVHEIDLATETSTLLAVTGDFELEDLHINYGYGGGSKIVGCLQNGKLSAFDPVTREFTRTTITPEVPGNIPNMPQFSYIGAMTRGVFFHGDVDGKTWAVRVPTVFGGAPATPPATPPPPPVQLPPSTTVEHGIAASVTRDTDLATHEDVVTYDNFVSKEYIATELLGVLMEAPEGSRPDLKNDCEIIDWPQYGMKAARCAAVTTNPRVVSWHKWGIPVFPAPYARPFMQPYGEGHTELYIRYLMRLDPDLAAGMTESGIKLPGGAGLFNYWQPGNYTDFPEIATWQARLWCTPPGQLAPEGKCRLATYYFGVDNKDVIYADAQPHNSTGTTQQGGITGVEATNAFLTLGEIHCIEQHIKLNTMAANSRAAWDFANSDWPNNFTREQLRHCIDEVTANANPDGEMRVWVDGVKAYERTGMRIRGLDFARLQDMPWLNVYHGGVQPPKAPFHVEIGGVCTATRYIGPPNKV